ncbi:MAG: FHA domain-containing protein [Formivibrio sp.]|nr:FHA domain-containing protein [Formivibrio sp.]
MAKLQVILDGSVVDEFRLTRGRITIGRRKNSDIFLDSPVVSGDHALIERIGRDVYLEDRDSTNGTKLNGKPVRRQKLRFGDEIRIARYTLHYCDDDAPAQPGFEHTLMMKEVRSGGGRVDTRPVVDAPTAVRNPPPVLGPLGVLSVLTGGNAGREITLIKSVTTLGKAGMQVAVVTRKQEGYFLSLVEGTQSPRVNGQEVGTQPRALQVGDQIEFMGVHMMFRHQLVTSSTSKEA